MKYTSANLLLDMNGCSSAGLKISLGFILCLMVSQCVVLNKSDAARTQFHQPENISQVQDTPVQQPDGVDALPKNDERGPETPGIEPMQPPDPAPAVVKLLDAEYLSKEERAEIRVRHGLWSENELTSPALTAAAMVASGNFGHDIFDATDPVALVASGVLPEDAAEALWRRGEVEKALELLKNITSPRGHRLAGEILIDMGEVAAAKQRLLAAAERINDPLLRDGDQLAEVVRAAMVLSRWQANTPGEKGVIDHQAMLGALGKARDQLNRLSWRTALAEAWLLYERDKYQEASQAALSALELHPKCADAWYLLGLMSVDTFDFTRAQRIAARLDKQSMQEGETNVTYSPFASVIRGYIMLRQNEGSAALRETARDVGLFPSARLLLQSRAAARGVTFDFAKTDELLAEYDKLVPNSPHAYLAVGKAMGDSRQYTQAANYLRIAAQRAPHWAEPTTQLGLSEFQAGKNSEAKIALERAAQLDPANIRASNSLLLIQEIESYVSTESDHFIVRCKAGVDEVVAAEMLGPLEEIFKRVTGNGPGGIQHVPAHKTVVELYPNHRWFGVRITGMPQLHTIAAATGPVIAMEAPREGPGHMGTFDWKRVVQHEYTHTVTLSRTNNRLPHWFTEASAVYLEDAPRDYSTVRLLTMAFETGRIFDLDTINIMFVRPQRPTDRSQAYAQGHLMYQCMIDKFGPEVPLQLMDFYAAGVREQDAFERVMGVSREQFMLRFRTYFEEKVQEWGMKSSEGTPTVAMLLSRKKAAAGDDAAQNDAEKSKDNKQDNNLIISTEESDDEGGATLTQLRSWAEGEHKSNPFVLGEYAKELLSSNGGRATTDSVAVLEEYAKARVTDPMPHKALAAYYLTSQRPADAIPHLEYLDIREQHSPGFAQELAKQYEATGDMSRASAKIGRAVQIAPYSASIREEAARVAVKTKDYATARRHLVALTKIEPQRGAHATRLEALDKIISNQK